MIELEPDFKLVAKCLPPTTIDVPSSKAVRATNIRAKNCLMHKDDLCRPIGKGLRYVIEGNAGTIIIGDLINQQ